MINAVLSKNRFLGMGLLMVLFIPLFSCVTTKEDLIVLNDRIVAVDHRVSKLNDSIDTTDKKINRELESKLEPLRQSQADMGVDIDNLRQELQGLSGRLEEYNQLVKRAVERDLTEQDQAKSVLSDLKSRLDELETSLKRLNRYLGLAPLTVPPKQEPEKPLPEAKALPEKPPAIEDKPVSPEQRLYELALAIYRDEKYEQAISNFRNFLEKYPQSDLADNAQFWIGESYMSLKQYEQAILAYQQVIKKYSKGNKVPNAMLRQAIAFYEIKDKTSAKLLLKRIIKKYPDSSEAKIAKAKLDTFK